MTEIKPISLEKVKSYSLKDRVSKVSTDCFGEPWSPDGSITRWLESLPEILAGTDFREIVGRMVQAATSDKTIILAMGAHPIKVGLSPIILDLMERGIISGVAMNGAGIIHDSEVAMAGNTSEDVAAVLGEGKFGMAEETGNFLNAAISEGAKQGMGLGRSIGAMLIREDFPYNHLSLLARAYELNIPVTVHVAIGTDIIHFHPNADGAAIGDDLSSGFPYFRQSRFNT